MSIMLLYYLLLVAIGLCTIVLIILILAEADELRDRLKSIEHLLTADKQPSITEATQGGSPVTHNPQEDAFYYKVEKKP